VWACRRGVVLGDSRVVGDATDGTYVTHETNERRHLCLAAKDPFWAGRAPSTHKSPWVPLVPSVSYPAVSIALTRLLPLPTPKRPHAVTSSGTDRVPDGAPTAKAGDRQSRRGRTGKGRRKGQGEVASSSYITALSPKLNRQNRRHRARQKAVL
jgi:hypothetical protein